MIQILCCENSCVGTLTTCSEVRASEEQAEGGKKLKQKETAKIQYKCHIIIDGDVSFYPYLHIHICLYACCVYACFVYMHVVCMHVLCICMLYVCMFCVYACCMYVCMRICMHARTGRCPKECRWVITNICRLYLSLTFSFCLKEIFNTMSISPEGSSLISLETCVVPLKSIISKLTCHSHTIECRSQFLLISNVSHVNKGMYVWISILCNTMIYL